MGAFEDFLAQVKSGQPQAPTAQGAQIQRIFNKVGTGNTAPSNILNTLINHDAAASSGYQMPDGAFDAAQMLSGGSTKLQDPYAELPVDPTAASSDSGYDDPMLAYLRNYIGSMGGGSVDPSSAIADINKTYDPNFAAITRQRGANATKNSKDKGEARTMFNGLADDYTRTSGEVKNDYGTEQKAQAGDYNKEVADVNNRYGGQIAALAKSLQGQDPATIAAATQSLKDQQSRVLDNLLQGNAANKNDVSARKDAQSQFYQAGSGAAKLTGDDKISDLVTALNTRNGQLDDTYNQLLASRSSDISKAKSAAAAASQQNNSDQLNAMFKYADLQRADALAGNTIANSKAKSAPAAFDPTKNKGLNIRLQGANFINSKNIPAYGKQQANDELDKFLQSDTDIMNGEYTPPGSDKPVKLTPQAIANKFIQYANANHLSTSERSLLSSALANIS